MAWNQSELLPDHGDWLSRRPSAPAASDAGCRRKRKSPVRRLRWALSREVFPGLLRRHRQRIVVIASGLLMLIAALPALVPALIQWRASLDEGMQTAIRNALRSAADSAQGEMSLQQQAAALRNLQDVENRYGRFLTGDQLRQIRTARMRLAARSGR